MTSSSSSSSAFAGSGRAKLLALLVSLVLVGASCAESAAPLDSEAARLFDIAGNRIADLTPDDSIENVPTNALQQAIARADSTGTALRVVVAPADGELVSAKAVVDQYGGTAISYKANDVSFEGASRDITGAQLDRAIAAAKEQLDIGDSATAFIQVLEDEGIEQASGGLPSWIWLVLLLGALAFMLTGAYSYYKARQRRIKRQADFVERKQMLTSWAAQLGPEVDSLRPLVAASEDSEAQTTWHDSQEFVSTIGAKLNEARQPAELDAAEMRIGRVAIKLRDLRRLLED